MSFKAEFKVINNTNTKLNIYVGGGKYVGRKAESRMCHYTNAFSSHVKNSEYRYSLFMARGTVYPQHF